MIVWHRTTSEAADAILSGGFRDASGLIVSGVPEEFEGVFISDTPLDANEGAKGDTLLRITLDATETEIADFELVEDEKPYREWLVPAALLNARGRAELFDEDSE